MAEKDQEKAQVEEKGSLYFFYRPKVNKDEAESLEDIERFYMLLYPRNHTIYRLAIIGRKHLPAIDDHERNWGFIEKVFHSKEALKKELAGGSYETKTRGVQHLPPARPAGEGVYKFIYTNNSLHLVFSLSKPEKEGPVQKTLHIPLEGAFVVSIKNPEKPSPPGTGLGEKEEVKFPKGLQKEFQGRRFADDPNMLNYEGAEFILIGARTNPEEEYNIDLLVRGQPDVYKELRLDKEKFPPEALFEGQWV